MLFCPIGTSKTKEGYVAIYGFDIDTLIPIKVNIPNNISSKIIIRKVYKIEALVDKMGIPEYTAKNIYESDDEIDIYDLLELAASSPTSILNDGNRGGIIRVDRVFKIVIGKNRVGIEASIVGIPDRVFDIMVCDCRWVDYWENQKEYADSELIKHFLNSRKVYMFLEYEQSYSVDSINCASMAVLK